MTQSGQASFSVSCFQCSVRPYNYKRLIDSVIILLEQSQSGERINSDAMANGNADAEVRTLEY